MRASQWSFAGGQLLRFSTDRQWGACPCFPFSAPFHRIGRNATLRPLIRMGRAGGEGSVASSKDVCSMTHWWHICASEIGRGWLWGTPHRFSLDEDHLLPHPQWAMGSGGHPFNCLPKINSLLELHCHGRRNEMALKWRQKTFTFVRYDYGCSLVPPCCYKGISVVQSLFHFLGLYCSSSSSFEPLAPCLLTLHCQAAGSISVHCRRLYILHIVCVQISTYETPAFYTVFSTRPYCSTFFFFWTTKRRNLFYSLVNY